MTAGGEGLLEVVHGALDEDRRAAEQHELLRARAATTHHSFGGSFSAVSTPIFTSKDAFCSIFRNLQNLHTSAGLGTLKNAKIVQISQKSAKFCEFLQNFLKIRINHEKFRNFRKISEIFTEF